METVYLLEMGLNMYHYKIGFVANSKTSKCIIILNKSRPFATYSKQMLQILVESFQFLVSDYTVKWKKK